MKLKWRLFEVNEADTIAAKSKSDAVKWYEKEIGEVIEICEITAKAAKRQKMWFPIEELPYNRRRGKHKVKKLDYPCITVSLKKALRYSIVDPQNPKGIFICTTEW